MRTMIEIGKDLLNLFNKVNRSNLKDIERNEATDNFVEIMNDFFQHIMNDMEK